MFKKRLAKPTIQVLKVQTEKRDVETINSSSLGYIGSERKTKTIKECSYTIVLFVKDGELFTREFNGKWDLSDVKKWEDL